MKQFNNLTIIFFILTSFFIFESCKEKTNKDKSGEIPFDFPVVETSAKENEYVLAPASEFVKEANEKGSDSARFIFYSRKCISTGKYESKLLEYFDTIIMPNSLIIPLQTGAKAKKGDILLTWWQSGSGMQRAIVVDDSIPETPIVKYLDIDFDNSISINDSLTIGQAAERLLPNSFVILSEELQAGTTFVHDDLGILTSYQVIRIVDEKILAIGWVGEIKVFNKADCIAIPINPEININDKVQVLYIGSYSEGTVLKIDKENGRYTVVVDFAGEKDTIIVAIGNITKNLEL